MPEVIDLTDIDSVPESKNKNEAGLVDAASYAHLRTAHQTTSHARLRAVLTEIVHSHPVVAGLLYGKLVTVQGKDDSDEESNSQDGSENEGRDGTNADRAKRARPVVSRWETCANCEEEYDAGTLRVTGECVYHPGDMEVNIDCFADHDERCHGPMDTEENRASFPENFNWNCCDEDGSHEGCEESKHRPRGPVAKRQRYS